MDENRTLRRDVKQGIQNAAAENGRVTLFRALGLAEQEGELTESDACCSVFAKRSGKKGLLPESRL